MGGISKLKTEKVVFSDCLSDEDVKNITRLRKALGRYLSANEFSGLILVYDHSELAYYITGGILFETEAKTKAFSTKIGSSIIGEMQNLLELESDFVEALMTSRPYPYVTEEVGFAYFAFFTLDIDFSIFRMMTTPNTGGYHHCKSDFQDIVREDKLLNYNPLEICPRCALLLRRCNCPFADDLPANEWQQTPEGAIPRAHFRYRI